jgi:hypothetical protein
MLKRRRTDTAVAALKLLGGAERKKVRVRGFAPWKPQAASLELLGKVRAVLAEYEDYLPLTIRQIFYRLVGAHRYEKTEQAYERLIEHLNRARRARLISFDAIRDDTSVVSEPDHWSSEAQFWATVRQMAKDFTLDRSDGQPTRLVVMCEAAGMVPQLERVAHPFGITVTSGGGFDSLTDKHKFAAALAEHDCPTEVLDIGDHDASGVHKHLAILEDVEAFTRDLGGSVTFTRLAVTPEQIRQYRLPTAPPKASDNRAFSGQTCQAEALAPDVLANILRTTIEQRLDRRNYQRVLKRERQLRRELLAQLQREELK